jgi:hypothetical protein
MATSKQMRILATRPHELVRYMTSGKLPAMVRPQGPLIDLLLQIRHEDLVALRQISVGPELGYFGRRTFETAAHALRWIRPDDEVYGTFPADSHRNKSRTAPVYLEDLLEACDNAPPYLANRYPHLCKIRPVAAAQNAGKSPMLR